MDRLGPQCAPWLLRGNRDWGNEGVISEAERRGQAYLFKLRLTKRVKRALERTMRDDDWRDAGAGWQGKQGEIGPWQGFGRNPHTSLPHGRPESLSTNRVCTKPC